MKDILFLNSIVFGTFIAGVLLAQDTSGVKGGPRYTIVAYSVASRPILCATQGDKDCTGVKSTHMEVTVTSGKDQRTRTTTRKCINVGCPLEDMTPHVEQAIREGLK